MSDDVYNAAVRAVIEKEGGQCTVAQIGRKCPKPPRLTPGLLRYLQHQAGLSVEVVDKKLQWVRLQDVGLTLSGAKGADRAQNEATNHVKERKPSRSKTHGRAATCRKQVIDQAMRSAVAAIIASTTNTKDSITSTAGAVDGAAQGQASKTGSPVKTATEEADSETETSLDHIRAEDILSQSRLKRLFREIDKDRDGVISDEEFRQALSGYLRKSLREVFRGTGVPREALVKRLGTGKIHFATFCKVARDQASNEYQESIEERERRGRSRRRRQRKSRETAIAEKKLNTAQAHVDDPLDAAFEAAYAKEQVPADDPLDAAFEVACAKGEVQKQQSSADDESEQKSSTPTQALEITVPTPRSRADSWLPLTPLCGESTPYGSEVKQSE